MRLKTTIEVQLRGEPDEAPATFRFQAKKLNDGLEFQRKLMQAKDDDGEKSRLFYTIIDDLVSISDLYDDEGNAITAEKFREIAPQVVVSELLLAYSKKVAGAEQADPEKKDSPSA